MCKVQLGRFVNALPYNLALLGLAVLMLSVLSNFLQNSQAPQTSLDTPAPSWNSTDRLVQSLQGRLRLLSQDQDAYVLLGGAYLQKARETGDPSYYTRAEGTLLKALELKPNNGSALKAMGNLAVARHQFPEAMEWARRALELNPKDPYANGVLGDAQIEVGQYAEAIQSFQTMVDLKPDLSSYARVSYVRELMGDVEGAIEAMEMAVAAGAPKGEGTAWAMVQLGNLYFNTGNIDEAAKHYEDALRSFGNYYLALAGLGKVSAAQGRYDQAIDLYGRAVAIIPQPDLLAAQGDLYTLTGQTDEAQRQYNTVEFIGNLAQINRQVYNRQLANFYSDHDLELEEALRLALKELEVRKDIFGYDAAAWAYYKNGRIEAAQEMIGQAMKLGTHDAKLYYHAGMIALARGEAAEAQRLLTEALAINPYFDPLQARIASRVLSELSSNDQTTVLSRPR